VVTFLLDRPPLDADVPAAEAALVLDETEQSALAELSDAGLVPPLRLVPAAGPGPRRPPPRRVPRRAAGRAAAG
jgi:hypothetical protein